MSLTPARLALYDRLGEVTRWPPDPNDPFAPKATLGNYLAWLRVRADLSQVRLGEALSTPARRVPATMISRWENEAVIPSIHVISLYRAHLGLNMDVAGRLYLEALERRDATRGN